MIEAKRIMRKAQVDLEEETLTWVTNSQGESDLLNQVQVVSTDFSGADRPTLVEGKVTRFMGFDIVYSERLSSASNVRNNIVAAKSGWYLGIWKDVENNISQRYDLSGLPYQIYTSMSSGATRLEPGRLLSALCEEMLGYIMIYRTEVRPFTDKQIELVTTFADQAVIAIENVRLFKELEVRNRDLTEALEQQTATGDILSVISSSPTDVQPVFDTIAARARGETGQTKSGARARAARTP